MKSVTTKIKVLANVEIKRAIYGIYNREVIAITDDYGLVIGAVTEEDIGNLQPGSYHGVTVVLEQFFSGRLLVSKILGSK